MGRTNHSSKFRGVSWNPHAGRFEARICIDSKKYYLGLFNDDVSAAIVYDCYAVRLGVPDRTNYAAHDYAGETPIVPTLKHEPCSVCNDAKMIRSQHLDNGEWIDDELIPCPKCQQNLS